MKNILRFTVLLAVVTVSLLASAQTYCNMYTYSDQWDDQNGNLVALNYTDADPCGDYSVQAGVQIQMPSGYQQSASGTGYTAQAIALAPITGEFGDGFINGTNAVSYQCGAYLAGSFLSLIHLDECACSQPRLDAGNCRLPCACFPGFMTDDMVQTPERLAEACQSARTPIPLGTCPSLVLTTRLTIGTPNLLISFDRVNSCHTSIQ